MAKSGSKAHSLPSQPGASTLFEVNLCYQIEWHGRVYLERCLSNLFACEPQKPIYFPLQANNHETTRNSSPPYSVGCTLTLPFYFTSKKCPLWPLTLISWLAVRPRPAGHKLLMVLDVSLLFGGPGSHGLLSECLLAAFPQCLALRVDPWSV